jgi:hypothetical protein
MASTLTFPDIGGLSVGDGAPSSARRVSFHEENMTAMAREKSNRNGGPVSIMHRSPYLDDDKKSINFSNTLRVVLIPSRGEYKQAGLNGSLWWTSKEFKEFQKTSNAEILLMAKYQNIDVRSARKKLYQPQECEDMQSELIHQACAPANSHSMNRDRLASNDSDYDYFDDVEENDDKNAADSDSDSDNENSRKYKLKKHVAKSFKKIRHMRPQSSGSPVSPGGSPKSMSFSLSAPSEEENNSGLPVIHSPTPHHLNGHDRSDSVYSPSHSPQPFSHVPHSPMAQGSPGRPQSPSVLPPGLRVRGDEVFNEDQLQSIVGLIPVSSLDNLHGGDGCGVEEVNMFFGNWEADDDLSLCVPLVEESLVSFEKMHNDLQARRSGNRPVRHHTAGGPGMISAGIAVVSAVLLAMVVLTSSGVQ